MGAIENYLDTYVKRRTRDLIRSSIKSFLISVYGGGFDRSGGEWESLADRYVGECRAQKRRYFDDLLSFITFLAEEKRPPASIYAYVNSVKNWITYTLDVDLTSRERKILRSRLPKGKRARTVEDDLTREKLQKILTHCDAKGRALFLFLVSSGIRIGEALQLRMGDIDLDHDPPKVTVRGEYTKAGDAYITFISKEARTALEEWLKIKDEYLESARNRGRGISKTGYGRGVKNGEDDRIFPFSSLVAHSMWANALKKAGLEERDNGTKRRTLHIHMLRKFFMSQLKLVIPEVIVEALAGHTGYLDEAYRRYTCKQIAEYYRKGEPYLYINVPREIREIQTGFQRDLNQLQKRVQDLTEKLTDANALVMKLFDERDELRGKVMALSEENRKLKEKFAKIEREIHSFKKLLERTAKD